MPTPRMRPRATDAMLAPSMQAAFPQRRSEGSQQAQPEADPAPEQAQAEARPPAQRRAAGKGGPRGRRAKATITSWRMYGVIAAAAVMVVGCLVGMLFFARPSISEAENRTLTQFPEFTWDSFRNGSYFTQASLWYADTYPLREPMVRASLAWKGLYGIQPEASMVGGNRTSDEIPVEGGSQTPAERVERPHDVSAPEMQAAAAGLEEQISNGVYVTDGAAYTLYYFDQEAADTYAGVINKAADELDGIATVYSIIVPTNAGVLLDADLQKDLGAANQQQAIDYIYSKMSDKVVPVPTFDVLYEHRDEYLYFRTDHHWTQLGAYYVYTSFCAAKGIDPAPYDQWEELVFEPFQGSYVHEVNVLPPVDNPDSVVARIPQGTNDMVFWPDDLNPDSATHCPVIMDLSEADEDAMYGCFAGGNYPLSMIENPAVTDGSSCLIIKDSFGNPLTTVMVDNYQYIYTFDCRYTSQDLVSFVKEHDIQDVIFENAVMFASTYDMADLLDLIVSGYNLPDSSASSASAEAKSEGAAEQ